MAKFNWNRFYDELETADSKKFPFWMWFGVEMFSFLPRLLANFLMSLVIAFWLVFMVGFIYNSDYFEPMLAEQFCKAFNLEK